MPLRRAAACARAHRRLFLCSHSLEASLLRGGSGVRMRTRSSYSPSSSANPAQFARLCARAHYLCGVFPASPAPTGPVPEGEFSACCPVRGMASAPPGYAHAHTIQPNPPSAAIPTRSTWLCARAHYFRRVFPAHDDTCTVPGLRGAFRACRSIRGMAAPGCAHAHTVEPARHRH